ncbi:hypothetical protein FA95DRAFT_1607554 [Auriscalpium vulgare]|uniref:Uncharacterized protein n=1 Tax=Auriscalpium vulgare TaxID=40419 RepID=A0ACB8RNX1_9AGAM|nr:hypothetical protein FA95DRAFT_1607554 [Auriscalpium vulgare]
MVDVVALLQSQMAFDRVQVATLTILVYEWFYLFADEVDLVWRSRWTLPKVLYLLSRYTPFIDMAVNTVLSTTFGMALSEIVMILRVQAMYDRSKRLLLILGTAWVILTVGALIFVHISSHATHFVPSSFIMSGCIALPSSLAHLALLSAFACLLVMETVLVLLTLKNAYTRWTSRYYFETFDLTFQTLYFDGVIFFVYLMCFSYLNMVFPLTEVNPELQAIFIMPMRAFHGIFSCRMLLNIRRVASRRVILPSALGSPYTLSPLTPVTGLPETPTRNHTRRRTNARRWEPVLEQIREVRVVKYGKEFDWVTKAPA